MANVPEGLFYSKDHEWLRVEGDTGTVGISDYAQAQLGDVVYVELPDIGKKVSKGDEAAVVESVKAASEVYAPVSGEVIAVNILYDHRDEDGIVTKARGRRKALLLADMDSTIVQGETLDELAGFAGVGARIAAIQGRELAVDEQQVGHGVGPPGLGESGTG